MKSQLKNQIDLYKENALSKREILEIDLRAAGSIMLFQAKALSAKVDKELLTPIGAWIDDSNWLKKLTKPENPSPNWALYKRQSRQWDKKQKQLAGERLKLYWQEIRRKKQFRKEIAQLFKKSTSRQNHPVNIQKGFLFSIIKPFSRPEQTRRKIKEEFKKQLDIPLSSLLPWRAILSSEITTTKQFSDIKVYITENKRQDRACKFMALLHLASDGLITITQTKPFEDFTIHPLNQATTCVSVKDESGNILKHDFQTLTHDEKDLLINKIKMRQVICKEVYHEKP